MFVDDRVTRGDPDFPFKLEESLKDRKVVPKDAYMVAWFYEAHRNGFTVRFMHKEFDVVPPYDMIPTVDAHKP